jgi:DNA-binding NarL/FixJ family response regulator
MVVDDHALVRDGLMRLLAQVPSVQPVGQASSGAEAIELARELNPEVALVDLRMPEMDGVETARRLQEVCPTIRVLILTGVETQEDLLRALDAGVYGYVPKTLPFDAVIRSIELAAVGGMTLPHELSRGALGRGHAPAEPDAAPTLAHSLTDRERQILQGIIVGESNRQIAQRLVISEHTVRAHLRNLMRKLGVANRAQAAAVAAGALAGEEGSAPTV